MSPAMLMLAEANSARAKAIETGDPTWHALADLFMRRAMSHAEQAAEDAATTEQEETCKAASNR